MNKELRLSIYSAGFDCQADFAMSIKEHESKISQVIRGRRKLSKEEAEQWRAVLKCDPAILVSVTKGEIE